MNAEEVKNDSRGVVTLRELSKQGNFFAQKFEKWWHLGHSLFAVPDTNEEKELGDWLFGTLGPGGQEHKKRITNSALIKMFGEKIQVAEKDIMANVGAFLPPGSELHAKLILQSTADETMSDPVEFLRKVFETSESKPVTACQFHRLRVLEMAAYYLLMSLTHYRTEKEIVGSNDDQMAVQFLSWLDPKINPEKEILEIGLDPLKQWTAVTYRLPGFQMPKRRKRLNYIETEVLKICLNRLHPRPVKAIVQARRKSLFEAFAKRFRDLQSPIWPDVTDLFGVRLIYRDYYSMKDGLKAVDRRAIWNNNPKVSYCATTNKHSQKTMHIKNQRVFVNGRQSEIQHILLKDWLNIEYSTRKENHTRYHLRWWADEKGVFTNLFPPALYGVDWTSDAVFRSLDQHVINEVRERNERLCLN